MAHANQHDDGATQKALADAIDSICVSRVNLDEVGRVTPGDVPQRASGPLFERRRIFMVQRQIFDNSFDVPPILKWVQGYPSIIKLINYRPII
jgi:hypothetical protein